LDNLHEDRCDCCFDPHRPMDYFSFILIFFFSV